MSNTERKLLEWIWLHEAPPPEPIDWVWEGYVAKGRTSLLSGFAKAGKSTLLGLLFKEMSGEGLGSLITPVKPTKVLILSEEHLEEWLERRERLELGDHIAHASTQWGHKLTAPQWLSLTGEVVEMCQEQGVGLVVYDTLARMSPARDENNSMEVAATLSTLDILKQSGLAVLLVHHARKGDGTVGSGQEGRGSGEFPAYGDINMEFGYYRVNQPEDDRRRVLCARGRPLGVPPKIVLELSDDGGTYEVLGTGAELAAKGLAEAIEGLLLGANGRSLSAGEIASKLVYSPKSGYLAKVLVKGVDEKRWVRVGGGRKNSPFQYVSGPGKSSGSGETEE